MKNKIKKILLQTLKSAYDGGNIDDGGIMGGDNAVDQIYDLFVDEATFVRHLENPDVPYTDNHKEHMKSTNSAKIPLNNEFSPTLEEKPKKVGDLPYVDPKTGKIHKLFDILMPVYTVCCRNDNAVKGYKGCAVYITVEAETEAKAIIQALRNHSFTSHLVLKYFDRKLLSVYKPTGNYVIGKVEYFEGDERL